MDVLMEHCLSVPGRWGVGENVRGRTETQSSLLSYKPCSGATQGRGIFLICSKALPGLEAALLSRKRELVSSLWNRECMVPRAI